MSHPAFPPHQRLWALMTSALLGASCTLIPAIPGQPAGGQVGTSGKTLLAIYMIGSDLEDDMNPRNKVPDELERGGLSTVGAGSDDLREIIEGYRSLSDAQKAKVDVFVAFGGARKHGWKGVKYADIQMLIADSADNYFGNLPTYLHTAPTANMGDGKVFADFVRRVKERAATTAADRTVVDMWNHGTAYLGMGPDKNSGGSMLRLPDITQGFKTNAFKADIIGFDACLMANLEVANAVQSAADLMVASEELEPGHGWDYTPLIRYMGQAIGTKTDLAKSFVDNFLDSPRHRSTNGRTLSVIDLTKLPMVLQSLDALAGRLSGDLQAAYTPLLTSVGSAQSYGKANKSSVEYSIDLRHFSELLQKRDASLAPEAGQLAQSVRDAVVYSREAGTKPQSNGLSIFSLNNLPMFERNGYTEQVAASPTWYRFVSSFMNRGKVDTSAPTIVSETPTVQNGQAGTLLTVADNTGISSLHTVHAALDAYPKDFPKAGKRVMVVATFEQEAQAKLNTYFVPDWDGRAISITANGRTMALPLEAEGVTSDGHQLYSAAVVGADQTGEYDMMFTIEWDPQSQQLVDYWLVPYTVGTDGTVTLDKHQFETEAGDTLRFLYHFVDAETGEETAELGPTLTMTGDPVLSLAKVPGSPFYFSIVSDLKGNDVLSTVHGVK